MAHNVWDFPVLGSGNEQGYTNGGIEMFRGAKVFDNLAREICQNSLDAKDDSKTEPVKVVFKLIMVAKNQHQVFADYEQCIKGCEKYWGAQSDSNLKSFLARAHNVLNKHEIPVLVVSDYNTKGLTGAKAKQERGV